MKAAERVEAANHLFKQAHILDARGRWARPKSERAAAEAAIAAVLGQGEAARFRRLRAEADGAHLQKAALRALQGLGYRQVLSAASLREHEHRVPADLTRGAVIVVAYFPALLTGLFLGAWNLAPHDPARYDGVVLMPGEERVFEFSGHDGRDLVWRARGSTGKPGVVKVVVQGAS